MTSNKKVLLKTRPKLVILEQPSRQHRARYESEGSRGAVKDATQDGSPKIQVKKQKFEVEFHRF